MTTIVGIAFPFRKGDQSDPQVSVDNQSIKESLVQLVMTAKGERVMRPTLGCNAYGYVFESQDGALDTLVRTDIATTIATYEKRVRVLSIDIERPEENHALITINYVVVATKQLDSVTIEV